MSKGFLGGLTIVLLIIIFLVIIAFVGVVFPDYLTPLSCEELCKSEGHLTGDCKLYSDFSESDKDLGSCFVKQSKDCRDLDKCGCYCVDEFDSRGLEKSFCNDEERGVFCTEEFSPVCGFFDPERIVCVKEPCAQSFSNGCFACSEENVLYYTEGFC